MVGLMNFSGLCCTLYVGRWLAHPFDKYLGVDLQSCLNCSLDPFVVTPPPSRLPANRGLPAWGKSSNGSGRM